jgi:hypothetical protein
MEQPTCINIVFLFHDTGEYNCLKPVMDYLNEVAGQKQQILCNGIIIDNGSCPKPEGGMKLLSSYKGCEMAITTYKTDSFEVGGAAIAHHFTSQILSTYKRNSNILIVGSISKRQLDIANAFYQTGKWYTIAFRDGYYSFRDSRNYGIQFLEMRCFHEFWFTCKTQMLDAKELTNHSIKDIDTKFKYAGDISILKWKNETNILSATDRANARRYMYGKDAVSTSSSRCILYYGGYPLENKYRDENHYMNSVRIFAEAAASLAGDDAQTSFYFAFVKHPGVPDTKCEEEIFKNAGASIKILDRTRYSTAIYTKASDITLSHHSTCSNLSVSVGVRSCYIAPIKIKYKCPGTFHKANLIPYIDDKVELINYLTAKDFNQNLFIERLRAIGIPKYPIQRTVKLIDNIVHEHSTTTCLLKESDRNIDIETLL